MKEIGKFFKEKRIQKGMSLRDVSAETGISHSHIFDLEKGKYSPSFDKVLKLLKFYQVDLQEFLRKSGYLSTEEPADTKKLRSIPVISWITAGTKDIHKPEIAKDWIKSDIEGANIFALRVRDDSMNPEFHEGDIVIVNPHIKVKPDDYVVAKNNKDKEPTFKQLKKYGNTLILHPLNPKYPDIELTTRHKYRIIGKVVEKRKKY